MFQWMYRTNIKNLEHTD